MRDTGSIRTAMRWLSYSMLSVAVISTGCVLNTTRFYVPTTGDRRITLDQMRSIADVMLPIECPRVVHGKNSVFATTDITLDVDSVGSVQRAEIERGSGDAALDDVFGALAARLQLQPPPDASVSSQPPSPPPAPAPSADTLSLHSTSISPAGPAAPTEQRELLVSYACASDAGTISLRLQPSSGQP